MFVCIIFLSHFLNVPLEITFLVCTTFELLKLTTFECLTTKCFLWTYLNDILYMHSCNWHLLYALFQLTTFALLILTILYASLPLTMFVCIILLSHFMNVPLEMTFFVCTTFELLKLITFEWLTTKYFYGLFWMTFCVHCYKNFLIHYCNRNPKYIDSVYFAKLSPNTNQT